MPDEALSAKTAVQFESVGQQLTTKSGPLVALDGVDFDILLREFVAVLGPSGCGKSTLLLLALSLTLFQIVSLLRQWLFPWSLPKYSD